jgi:hypothetical protein
LEALSAHRSVGGTVAAASGTEGTVFKTTDGGALRACRKTKNPNAL